MISLKQKLLFLVLCLCFGISLGKTDSSFILMINGFGNMFNYVIYYQLGFSKLFHFYPPVNFMPVLKLMSNSLVLENNVSFLVLPTLLFLFGNLLLNIKTNKKRKLLIFIVGALIISATWDASYCYFIDGFLAPWEKGAKVQWLPLENPFNFLHYYLFFGVTPDQINSIRDLLYNFLFYQTIEGINVGISFYWNVGYVFILARFILALVLLFFRRKNARNR